MEGLRKLYLGEFNTINQESQPDGSIIITLCKDNEGKTYRFKVKNLYGEHEEVLEHKVIEHKPSQWVLDRMEEAKKHNG